MYKAIIADDEIRICILLRKLIAWDALGIEIIEECYDGPSTLQAIFDKRPDIVISDIRMPGMDGLEIVRRCNDAKINCAFLLISGHAEFEYARMAIQYNVENYLLKPINKDELENNLFQIKEQLERSNRVSTQQSDMNNQLQIDKDVLQSQFLNNSLLIPDWIKRSTFASVREKFHIDLDPDGTFYIVGLECIDKTEFTMEQHQLLLKQIQNYTQQILSNAQRQAIPLLCFPKLYFLVLQENMRSFEEFVSALFETLQNRFFEYCDVAVGVSAAIHGLENLSVQSRAQADFALRHRYNQGGGSPYYFEKIEPYRHALQVNESILEFRICIENANRERLSRFFAGLIEQSAPADTDLDMLFELISHMKVELVERSKKLNSSVNNTQQMIAEMDTIIWNSSSKQDLLEQMEEYIQAELQKYSDTQTKAQSQQIAIAIEYMQNNYRRDISLNEISGIVYMSPTYFSSLFKKVTQKNFGDYLTEIRIEQSKKLLSSTLMPISKLAEEVGYKSSHYFSKVFLKTVGIKPSEYRRLYLEL